MTPDTRYICEALNDIARELNAIHIVLSTMLEEMCDNNQKIHVESKDEER